MRVPAILSNGSPDMLESAVESAGIDKLVDQVFSIHPLMVFKTSPETYRMVTDYWKIDRKEVSFQSSNRWDIAGATAFGFDCAWINRTGQPDEYTDLAPTRVYSDFNGLLEAEAGCYLSASGCPKCRAPGPFPASWRLNV